MRIARHRHRPRAPAITRSARPPTCWGVSPPGHPSRNSSQPGAVSWICVSRARCIGLQRTSAKFCLTSIRRSFSATRLPFSVNGISVVPACWPLRLHAVSPCLIANTFTLAPLKLRRCRPLHSTRIRRSIDPCRQSGISHQSLGSAVSIGTTFGTTVSARRAKQLPP